MEKDDWEDIPSAGEKDDWQDVDGGEPDKSIGQSVSDFANSMALGSSIGENLTIPFTDIYPMKPIAKAGAWLGGTLEAGIEAPFSDKSFSDLYQRNMKANERDAAEEEMYDKRSPSAMAVKNVLAGLAAGPLKRPTPLSEMRVPRDPFVKSGGFAERTMQAERAAAEEANAIGKFAYPGGEAAANADKAALIKEYLAKQEAVKKAAGQPSLIQKYGPRVLEEGIDLLPYGIRKPIQIIRKIKK